MLTKKLVKEPAPRISISADRHTFADALRVPATAIVQLIRIQQDFHNVNNRPEMYNLDMTILSSATPKLLIRTQPSSMSKESGTPMLIRMALHAAPQVQVKHTLNSAVLHAENNRCCFRNSRHDGVFHGRRCPLFGATLLLTFINSLVCGGHDPDDKSGSRRISRSSGARGIIVML